MTEVKNNFSTDNRILAYWMSLVCLLLAAMFYQVQGFLGFMQDSLNQLERAEEVFFLAWAGGSMVYGLAFIILAWKHIGKKISAEILIVLMVYAILAILGYRVGNTFSNVLGYVALGLSLGLILLVRMAFKKRINERLIIAFISYICFLALLFLANFCLSQMLDSTPVY